VTLPGERGPAPARDAGAPPVVGGYGRMMQPGTMTRALLTGAVLIAGLGAIAALTFRHEATPPLDRYVKLGPDGAAAALKRDMLAEFPPGTPVNPLVRKLQDLGLACLPQAEPPGAWTCGISVQAERRRATQVQVLITTSLDRVVSLETRVADRPL